MAAGMWGRAVPPDRDPGALRAALMTISAVAWAARWAVSGRTDNGTVRYWNPLNTPPGERTRATKHLVPSSLRF